MRVCAILWLCFLILRFVLSINPFNIICFMSFGVWERGLSVTQNISSFTWVFYDSLTFLLVCTYKQESQFLSLQSSHCTFGLSIHDHWNHKCLMNYTSESADNLEVNLRSCCYKLLHIKYHEIIMVLILLWTVCLNFDRKHWNDI